MHPARRAADPRLPVRAENWEKLTAAAVIVTVPAVAVFLVAQRCLVSGHTHGGVKG